MTDGIGSTIALTDANGNTANTYSYDPYGNQVSSTGTVANPYKFAGQHQDASGLYKTGARYYDPMLGRWTTQDPITDTLDRHGANPYAYANDDPVNIADPSGLAGDIGWTGPICANIRTVSRQWAYANCPASLYCEFYSCATSHKLAPWEACVNSLVSKEGISFYAGREAIIHYLAHVSMKFLAARLKTLGYVADAAICLVHASGR